MRKSYVIFGLVLMAILIAAIFWVYPSKPQVEVEDVPGVSTTTDTVKDEPKTVVYKNNVYGISVSLPLTWENYTVVMDPWEGYSLQTGEQKITEEGFTLLIRHPDWDYKAPRQDIPVMIFTLKQWDDMQSDKFHIGAAPINPSELGRNSKYVFALPARYNFSYLTGFEEVEEILKSKPFLFFSAQ